MASAVVDVALVIVVSMLKVFEWTRGSIRFLALFALSAFLICTLLPHHSHADASATSGTTNVSAAPQSASEDRSVDAGASASEAGHDALQSPFPVCHNEGTQVMDLSKQFVPTTSSDMLGLLGALLVAVLCAARLNARPRAPLWSTQPPRMLAGFPLLIALGVSRT